MRFRVKEVSDIMESQKTPIKVSDEPPSEGFGKAQEEPPSNKRHGRLGAAIRLMDRENRLIPGSLGFGILSALFRR